MKNYIVPFKVLCNVYVKVEAEDKEEAIEKAYGEVYLSSYAGNGGGDKLIGVSDSYMSVEPGDHFEVLEDIVEEITNQP